MPHTRRPGSKALSLAFAIALALPMTLSAFPIPLIVAHRGASAHAPENTLPAFVLAWEHGADAIELDVHLTADGHLVAIHDARTQRVAARDLAVRRSTLSDLRALDVGSWRGATWAGTRISTLSEVLAAAPPDKLVFVELKASRRAVPALAAALAASGLPTERIRVISFNASALRLLKRLAPQYRTSWLVDFETSRSGRLKPSLEKVLAKLRRCKADALGSSASGRIGRSFVEALGAAGYELHVWTVDSPTAARRFARIGVASITTNDPAKIRAALEEL